MACTMRVSAAITCTSTASPSVGLCADDSFRLALLYRVPAGMPSLAAILATS